MHKTNHRLLIIVENLYMQNYMYLSCCYIYTCFPFFHQKRTRKNSLAGESLRLHPQNTTCTWVCSMSKKPCSRKSAVFFAFRRAHRRRTSSSSGYFDIIFLVVKECHNFRSLLSLSQPVAHFQSLCSGKMVYVTGALHYSYFIFIEQRCMYIHNAVSAYIFIADLCAT